MKTIKQMEGEVNNLTHPLFMCVLAVLTIVLTLLILQFIINILCGVFLSG